MRLTLSEWRERLRTSLFFVPALFIVTAVLAIVATDMIDTRLPDLVDRLPLLHSADAENSRQVLSTIAAATVTVSGIVFSVTVVAVQLTSSQFSPRVLRGFLRDRFDQVIIGLVVATFVYCLVALVTTPSGPAGQDPAAEVRHLTLTVAVALGIASILAIVAFIDHSARAMQVGHIIRSITDETRSRISSVLPSSDERTAQGRVGDHEPDEPGFTVRSDRDGWVQQLDPAGMLHTLAPGSTARVEIRVGSFVAEGTPLLTVWPRPEDPERFLSSVRDLVAIGRTRTMQQDLAFGIRQLVDIALRALSPGVNDPTTAYDVLANLGAILADLMQRELPPAVLHGDDGRVLLRPHELDHARYVGRAFDQIRLAGADDPAIGTTLLRVIGRVDELLGHRGLQDRRAPLRDQARRVVETIEASRPDDEDTRNVRRVAKSLGLLAPLGSRAADQPPTSSESRTDDEDAGTDAG